MGGFSSASSFFLSLLNQKNVKKIKFFSFLSIREWKFARSANSVHSNGNYHGGTKVHITVTSQWYVFPLDMCFPEHISPVKCISLTRESIPQEICLSRVGKHISPGMWVRGKTYHGETHITVTLQLYEFPRTMCFPENIFPEKCVFPAREHMSLGIRFRENTSDQTLSVYFPR